MKSEAVEMPEHRAPGSCAEYVPLTGRAPYGYQLSGQGNEAAFEPDPLTAPVVRRIFADYVGGSGLQVIAERLTADRILCPSAYDPRRNPHHIGSAWSKPAVRAIITNERYAVDDASGPPGNCSQCAHRCATRNRPPLVPIGMYRQAQEILARRGGSNRGHEHLTRYALRGVLRCQLCQRLMQGTWNNHAAYYRCRFPREYAKANNLDHPPNIYLREDRLVEPLLNWISRSLPIRLREWAVHHPPTLQERIANRARILRKLVDDARRDRAHSTELYSTLGMRLVYEPVCNSVQVRSEVLPGAVFTDNIEL